MALVKFIAYVPEPALEAVKTAIFAAGAGRYGDEPYDCCAWQTLGMGQFRPLAGASPAIGRTGAVTQVPEWRLEVLTARENLPAIIAAYIAAHPYEVPAYDLIPLLDPNSL